jgi:hypothetical protein
MSFFVSETYSGWRVGFSEKSISPAKVILHISSTYIKIDA